jgi:O-antigen/teichoic acid export membrane protein
VSKRVLRLLRTKGFAAVVAQVWQAVGSFGLQLAAAWILGAAGLGLMSLCLGVIVLATAVVSGMVGDTLVIRDRHDRRLRAGLQFWTIVLGVGSALITSTVMAVSGLLTAPQAALFGAALLLFQLEELVRRVFMATMRFWNLVLIDSSAVVTALLVVLASWLGGWTSIGSFLLALLVGQSVGLLVGVAMLPGPERRLVSLRGAAIADVLGFGGWRGAQVAVPPLVLTLTRLLVTATVGIAALGQLEAARILVAPALLAVQGLGSYLLSSYVRDKSVGLPVLVKRAGRAAAGMIGAALLLGGALVLAAPAVAPLIIGPDVRIDRLAVAGWAFYVAGSASCQPFASLAAAQGRPAAVFLCRSIDAVTALAVVAALLMPLALGASVVPFALGAGLFLGGALVRLAVLRPLLRRHAADTVAATISRRTSYVTQ